MGAIQVLFHAVDGRPAWADAGAAVAVAVGVVFEEGTGEAGTSLGVFGRGGDGDAAPLVGVVFVVFVWWWETLV